MDHSPQPPFTARARLAMVATNRLAERRNSDTIGSQFVVISAIQADDRLVSQIPQFQFSADELLDALADRNCDVRSQDTKSLLLQAFSTTHILLAAVTDPDPAVTALLAELKLTAEEVASVVEKLLDE